ncbi:pyrroloquinoline quinone biosynthesis protein PqqB [Ancylobacter polymorphus]|uniref:Coenzyme PQQ synthesis protein B n=1 Tax=Ancylobacter polymorphus TaxID=223390 RepID=A0A9E6ZVG3_9HYPH|nr:pyrroloquinoline quinone biosynthesis protein PqqB [Ancylobacter polymorphus]UOK70772.1 pyrroloquinoline quinone biosynthesis protein PqqB [Ancylobacter polymorphus]
MTTPPSHFKLVILGSAAGGGFPQWNCRCAVCSLAWANDPRVKRRTQASIAVTSNGRDWALVNCAPEILAQLQATPALHPREGLRHSPLKSVLLTNADIDHVAGLLSLREAQPFALMATPGVHGVLAGSSAFDVLAPDVVARRPVQLGASFELVSGVHATIFPVPGKIALYLEAREQAEQGSLTTDREGEQTIGVELAAGGRRVLYIPGCAAMTDTLRARLDGADAVLFDGTLWQDDEMVLAGVGTKTGARMGHMSMSGPRGSIEALREVNVGRKIYVHINNTNPVLVDGSDERITANKAGWEIAHDGMEIAL